MFLRTTSAALSSAAILALALPAVSDARTDAQVAGGYGQPAAPAAAVVPTATTTPTVTVHHDGLDTLAVVGLAGGTLLLGAAGGFGGGRLAGRRGPAVRA